MSAIDKVKQAQIQARKDKDAFKTGLLTSLYADACLPGLNDGKRISTDSEVFAVVKKYINTIDENLTKVTDATAVAKYNAEKQILQSFLPTALSPEQLSNIVESLLADIGNEVPGKQKLGVVMRHLTQNYTGQYDGNVARQIVESKL